MSKFDILEIKIKESNEKYHTAFSLGSTYGQYDLWVKNKDGDHRLESGSLKDVYNAWVKYRFNEKYTLQKQSIENPNLKPRVAQGTNMQIEGNVIEKCYVDLDTADEDNLEKDIKRFGVKCKLIDPHGPGGGNPVYRFFGTREALTKMINKLWDDGGGDMSYLTDFIKKTKVKTESRKIVKINTRLIAESMGEFPEKPSKWGQEYEPTEGFMACKEFYYEILKLKNQFKYKRHLWEKLDNKSQNDVLEKFNSLLNIFKYISNFDA